MLGSLFLCYLFYQKSVGKVSFYVMFVKELNNEETFMLMIVSLICDCLFKFLIARLIWPIIRNLLGDQELDLLAGMLKA